MNNETGEISSEVANYWRESGYDLRHYLAENWSVIGSDLVGKLHFICGDMDDFFLNLQVWGTPEQCFERIMKIREQVQNDTFTGVFSYSGMPYEDAEASMRLFASDVMPELKKVGS